MSGITWLFLMSNSCVIDQTTLKGNKNTNSDTFMTKAPLSARKEIMKNPLDIKVHIYGSEAPSEPPQNP